MNQPGTRLWPMYFQPWPTQVEPAIQPALRIPATVVDLFSIRDPESGRAERVAIIACLEGSIDVVAAPASQALDHAIQDQIQISEVNRRGRFRQITAAELYITTLDAVEQEIQTPGFNDAVYLYGRIQARISFSHGRTHVTRLDNAGRFAVGRLDVLYACKEMAAHVFHSPDGNDEQLYHLMIPAASADEIAYGRGVVLMYPLLDTLGSANVGNTVVVMRTAYDLLARLQQDMIAEQHRHPFTNAVVPIPNRRRLERELEADG